MAQQYSRKRIQHVVLDTTGAYTEMCHIGKLCQTDKTPYGDTHKHRHPYTGFYSMLFAPLKNKPIQFAEIGIAGANSVMLWYNYFTAPERLCFFDRCPISIKRVEDMNFPRPPYTGIMDVSVDGDIKRALNGVGGIFDVILDDSSHDFDHQIRIIKEAWPFVKSGGYVIVEDIFRNRAEADYEKELDEILEDCAEAYFVVCNHEERFSPGWNNDKVLVFVKN